MKALLITIFLLVGVSFIAKAETWELNDVSVLMSLPNAQDPADFLLNPASAGLLGELLPKVHSVQLKDLVIDLTDAPADSFGALRVLAMRIDPCFKFLADPASKCSSVLRLIWQPINMKLFTTYDAAVHTFYDLTQAEFKSLATRLKDLKKKNAGLGIVTDSMPLNIHPAYQHIQQRAAFNLEIKKIILNFSGSKKLVRFTVMKQMTKDMWWQFLGREKNANGEWQDMNIPRFGPKEITQDFFNDAFNVELGMRGAFTPYNKFTSDDLTKLVAGPDIKPDEYDTKALKEGLITINRIENPRIHSPATMDCVHCHITEPTMIWAEKEAPGMVVQLKTTEGQYVQAFGRKHNLSNLTKSNKNNKSLRAFGYFKDRPSINQRTINESSAVAEDMNEAGF